MKYKLIEIKLKLKKFEVYSIQIQFFIHLFNLI